MRQQDGNANGYANYAYGQSYPYYGAQQQQQAAHQNGYQAYPAQAQGAQVQQPVHTNQMQGYYPPYSGGGAAGGLTAQESYIENILRLNRGKLATVYMSFENSSEWSSKVFKGIIEAAGRDHIILSDPQSGKRYVLLMVYLDYITFDEEIEYEYPFAGTSYLPR